MNDEDYIREIRESRRNAVEFFSHKGKIERERWVVNEFAQNLNLVFEQSDISSATSDPPDALFLGAAFEIKEVMDDNSRRHADYKEALAVALSATRAADLIEDAEAANIVYCNAFDIVLDRAKRYARKYASAVVSSLDLLLYLNKSDQKPFLGDSNSQRVELAFVGWRSVSFILGSNSVVAYVAPSAPAFLRNAYEERWSDENDSMTTFR